MSAAAADIPKIFAGLFAQDVPVKGQIGMVMPPPEIDKYVAKVGAAARKDPAWFREFSKTAKPGIPLPYNSWPERRWREAFTGLGLTPKIWLNKLGLYTVPANWLFDRSLHFIARLDPI